MEQQKFATIAELIDEDQRSQLDDSEFDDQLWLFLCEHISSPRDIDRFARPVMLYYASRYVQWEVGNGGFAQAAYNVPDWFDLAALGYEALGLTDFAGLIREAMALLPETSNLDAQEIGELFEQFAESQLALLDKRLEGIEWDVDDIRVRYVRENRQAFRDAV